MTGKARQDKAHTQPVIPRGAKQSWLPTKLGRCRLRKKKLFLQHTHTHTEIMSAIIMHVHVQAVLSVCRCTAAFYMEIEIYDLRFRWQTLSITNYKIVQFRKKIEQKFLKKPTKNSCKLAIC